MARQWQSPTGTYILETTARQWQSPDGAYINDTTAAAAPPSSTSQPQSEFFF